MADFTVYYDYWQDDYPCGNMLRGVKLIKAASMRAAATKFMKKFPNRDAHLIINGCPRMSWANNPIKKILLKKEGG